MYENEIWKITKRFTPEQILEKEKLWPIWLDLVLTWKIHQIEINLNKIYVILNISKNDYDLLKKSTKIIVNSQGIWNSPNSRKVKFLDLKTKKRIKIIPFL